MKTSESITEIAKALVQFRKEVKQPLKDADNPFFRSKYVPLENVVEAIDEVAPNHGLTFTQWALNDESGRVGVATLLIHESGEFIEYDPVYMNADKNTPQGAGSLITYLKRYTLSAIFGITSDEDDDGNQATKNQETQQRKQQFQEHKKKQEQDKGKVALVQQNAEDLKKIINENAEEGKEMTTDQIISAYLKQLNINNLSSASNEQLINMSKLIKQNIDKYNK